MRARKPVRLVPLDSHNVPSGRTTTISTSTVTTTTITTYMHAVQLRGGGDAPLAPRRMVRDDSPTAHGARRFTHSAWCETIHPHHSARGAAGRGEDG